MNREQFSAHGAPTCLILCRSHSTRGNRAITIVPYSQLQRRQQPGAVGAREVRELDDRHGRIGRAVGGKPVGGHLVAVDLVNGQDAETLVRTVTEHFVPFGGVPLCAVFDRPRTVALTRDERGKITEWPRTTRWRARVRLRDSGAGVHRGDVLNLVGWVGSSGFRVDERAMRSAATRSSGP